MLNAWFAMQVVSELLELLDDEMEPVQLEAFEAFVEVFDMVGDDMLREKLLPRLHLVMEHPSLLLRFLKGQGKIYFKISITSPDVLGEGSRLATLALLTFKRSAESSDEIQKQACAYNLPAMTRVFGPSRYREHLHQILCRFARDGCVGVRATTAAGFHEVCGVLGNSKDLARTMKEPLLALLECGEATVREPLLQYLGQTLQQFRSGNEAAKKPNKDLAKALAVVECEAGIGTNWRLQEALVRSWAWGPCCIDSDGISDHLVPALIKILKNRDTADAVAHAATRSLCTLLRRNRSRVQRAVITKRICRDFGHARMWRERVSPRPRPRLRLACPPHHAVVLQHTYLDFCAAACEQFSKQLVKSCFLDDFLKLAQDPVPNVKLRWLEIAPSMRGCMIPGKDDAAIRTLSAVLGEKPCEEDRQLSEMRASTLGLIQGWLTTHRMEKDELSKELMLQEEEDDLQETEVSDGHHHGDHHGVMGLGYHAMGDFGSDEEGGRDAAIEAAMKQFLSEQDKNEKKAGRPGRSTGSVVNRRTSMGRVTTGFTIGQRGESLPTAVAMDALAGEIVVMKGTPRPDLDLDGQPSGGAEAATGAGSSARGRRGGGHGGAGKADGLSKHKVLPDIGHAHAPASARTPGGVKRRPRGEVAGGANRNTTPGARSGQQASGRVGRGSLSGPSRGIGMQHTAVWCEEPPAVPVATATSPSDGTDMEAITPSPPRGLGAAGSAGRKGGGRSGRSMSFVSSSSGGRSRGTKRGS